MGDGCVAVAHGFSGRGDYATANVPASVFHLQLHSGSRGVQPLLPVPF